LEGDEEGELVVVDSVTLAIFTIITSTGLRDYNICTAIVNK